MASIKEYVKGADVMHPHPSMTAKGIAADIFDCIQNHTDEPSNSWLHDSIIELASDLAGRMDQCNRDYISALDEVAKVRREYDERIEAMTGERLDAALKEHLARRTSELAAREAAVAMKEEQLWDVQERISKAEAKARENLDTMKWGLDKCRAEIKELQVEWNRTKDEIKAGKEQHMGNVRDLLAMIIRVRELIEAYGEIEGATDLVVDGMLEHFGDPNER